MSNSAKITEPPTEAPKSLDKSLTEAPKPVTEAPTEAPKKEVTEAPKVEQKPVTEAPKPVTEAPTEAPKPQITEAPKKELVLKPKRKQSPKQLANLSKGRGKPKVGGSETKSLEAPKPEAGEVKPNKTLFYAGIAIGVLAGSFGILKLYQIWKNKQNPELAQPNIKESPQLAEPKLTPKELERLQKIEEAKRNFIE